MKKLQIAVGIIRNENNEIFITRRATGAAKGEISAKANNGRVVNKPVCAVVSE